jgi:thiosulfate reductase cytochrome b subunit
VLQSLTYLVVVFVLLPLVVLAGLAMSPRIDTVFTGWVELLGGRQSARTLHFLAAFALLAFVLVHVFEVFVAGVWNELRSMITGWYVLPADPAPRLVAAAAPEEGVGAHAAPVVIRKEVQP